MRNHTSVTAISLLAAALLSVSCSSSDDDDSEGPSWVGQTFELTVPPASWYEPESVGAEIGTFVPPFIIEINSESGGNLEVMLGTGDGTGAQQMCNPTTTTTATANYPEVQIGPVDFPIYLKHTREDVAVNATVYDLTMTNVLPDGDTASGAGELIATLDAREVASMFTVLPDPTPEAVCTTLVSMGSGCEACRTDGEEYCLTMKSRRLGATEGQPLQAIDAGSVPATCIP
jgi:hypothetical protein